MPTLISGVDGGNPVSPPGPTTTLVPETLAIHLDLVGGISGDMFVAAMVDALPALAPAVLAELAAVQPAGLPGPGFREIPSGGLRARRFGLTPEPASAAYRAVPTRDRATQAGMIGTQDHGGTAYTVLQRRLVASPLTEPTREHALAILGLLADAEAHVHGMSVDAVHFHEVGDWDSLLDVVAAGCIAGKLAGAHWSASALPLGGGTVSTAHGLLPVPVPATSLLLTGYPWHDDGIGGERVTPTGAAILRHLVPADQCAARRQAGRLASVGCGAGTRKLPGVPNILRALVLERAVPDRDSDTVAVLEFDVDDMTGEEIGTAAERLRLDPGVVDVSVGARQGKKGRPVADFRLLARPQAAETVARACFTETSTLGLRLREERRCVLERSEVEATIDGGTVNVKIATRPGDRRSGKAAQDDVAATRGLGKRRSKGASAVQGVLEGIRCRGEAR